MFILNLLILLFLSALFSGAETAFTSISPTKAEVLRKQKGLLNKITVFLYDHLDVVIMINLIVSNLVNIIISAYITVLATNYFGEGVGLAYAIAIGTILILVMGEIVPKKLAILFSIGFSKFAAYILYALYYVLYPIVIPLSHLMKNIDKWAVRDKEKIKDISEEEVGAMLDLGKKEGALNKQEYEMIKKLLLLNDKEVKDVMTRQNDIVAINQDAKLRDLLELSANSKHSRIPVYHEDINEIDHVISIPKIIPYLTDFNNLDKKVMEFNPHKAFKVPESKILDDLFFEFQKKRVHLAIAVNEFGETSGLISLEDIVEEIFGDIEDETDTVKIKIRKNRKGEIFSDGDVILDDLLKFLKIELEEDENRPMNKTISWMILNKLHRFPQEGEKIDFDDEMGLSFVVIDMDEEYIDKVRVIKKKAQ